ncbi:unnamed protein product [marine sediment metagenome]|uniref:Uncharacterized protein n=1 Tax=marine sediment metagenome TaxID=412755 RepID=X1QF29_9ZZZZ
MEYTEHYEGMEQRNNLCDIANSNGFRMLHDDFDEDWKRGDEPHGTLTFTDEPAPQAPSPEPLVFTNSPPGTAIGERLNNIEDFLKEAFPE